MIRSQPESLAEAPEASITVGASHCCQLADVIPDEVALEIGRVDRLKQRPIQHYRIHRVRRRRLVHFGLGKLNQRRARRPHYHRTLGAAPSRIGNHVPQLVGGLLPQTGDIEIHREAAAAL